MIFGTFDVFHPGHRFFIEEALKRSREHDLVVVVARDVTVKTIKGTLRNPEGYRLAALQRAFPGLTCVLGDEVDPMRVVEEHRPELVCLGYDQVGFSEQLRRAYPEIRIERLPSYHPEVYKSSKMG